jgi:hypothetical protein
MASTKVGTANWLPEGVFDHPPQFRGWGINE